MGKLGLKMDKFGLKMGKFGLKMGKIGLKNYPGYPECFILDNYLGLYPDILDKNYPDGHSTRNLNQVNHLIELHASSATEAERSIKAHQAVCIDATQFRGPTTVIFMEKNK